MFSDEILRSRRSISTKTLDIRAAGRHDVLAAGNNRSRARVQRPTIALRNETVYLLRVYTLAIRTRRCYELESQTIEGILFVSALKNASYNSITAV